MTDVKRGVFRRALICLQEWLTFLCFLTVYLTWELISLGCKILVFVSTEITNGMGWNLIPLLTLALLGTKCLIMCLIFCCIVGMRWVPAMSRSKWKCFGSLAFGGRGIGICQKHRKQNKTMDFDSTRGYPGEGWSNEFPDMTMGTWNTCSRPHA